MERLWNAFHNRSVTPQYPTSGVRKNSQRVKNWRSPGSYGLGLTHHPLRYSEDRARVGSVAAKFIELWATDVCVLISRLAECITETQKDLAASFLPAPIVGHAGDGNFHVLFVLNPNDPREMAEAERLNERVVHRALSLDGTCTGEHGIGCGKIDFLIAEQGDAISVMRAIKKALDPDKIMNPGKILRV